VIKLISNFDTLLSLTTQDVKKQLDKLRIDKAASADGLLSTEIRDEICYPLFRILKKNSVRRVCQRIGSQQTSLQFVRKVTEILLKITDQSVSLARLAKYLNLYYEIPW